MIQLPININDKKGSEYTLRTPKSDEAQIILDVMAEIASRSPYILSTPESFRSRSLELQIKWIEESEKSDTSVIIGAYDKNDKIIGLCNGSSYKDVKRQHRAALGVSIHSDFHGLGIGKKLMEVLLNNMKTFKGIKMIELDVMTDNFPALKMYENLGFKRGGVFPKAFILPEGKVVDNLTMYMEV